MNNRPSRKAISFWIHTALVSPDRLPKQFWPPGTTFAGEDGMIRIYVPGGTEWGHCEFEIIIKEKE